MSGSVAAVFQPKWGTTRTWNSQWCVVGWVEESSANSKLPLKQFRIAIVYQVYKFLKILSLALSFHPPSHA
jgi:hypothetical protein